MGWLSQEDVIGIGYTQKEAMKDLVRTYNRSDLSKYKDGRLVKNEDTYVMVLNRSNNIIKEITVEKFLENDKILSGTSRQWIAKISRDGITNYQDSLRESSI